MDLIEEPFVDFELAVLLAEKGFDVKCKSFYGEAYKDPQHGEKTIYKRIEDFQYHIQREKVTVPCETLTAGSQGELVHTLGTCDIEALLAPTHRLVFEWLEKIYGIYIDVLTYPTGQMAFRWVGYQKGRLFSEAEGAVVYYKTRIAAERAAIKYCLENLIER